jgi:hypothetical protein
MTAIEAPPEIEQESEALAEDTWYRPLADEDKRTVYERMVAIIDELPAIGKTQENTQQRFMFRGHDDVMNALNPLLAKHGVFVVPDVLERVTGERLTGNNKTMYEVNLHVAFTFYGLLGDSFRASGWGEGTDMGDKSTSKAMTMAFKYVIGQAFALATAEISDADATSPEETSRDRGERTRRASEGERRTADFDPGRNLLDSAIDVRSAEDADAVRRGMRDMDSTQNWPAIEEFLATSVFGHGLNELTRTETAEYWKRLANAVVKADAGGFPPPTHEQLREAFAWAFKGTVVAFSEPETAAEGEAQPETPEGPPGGTGPSDEGMA